ncbi:lysophospholipid acyltransferase family protein [Zoogloea sp.]|jgi:KDO2-lipid IV(A) lauroyltransferase|uniref:lysophospholipid acyltransferase family protein n=1 Tax=Zoogloea sp. TaxID=49181 RepID=UPI001B6145BE|nr:lysophospholipid acyltransferase family protein [Zoogloea sp.]MBK7849174.1 lysophospholipid acyltransferase family protein [Zoogloea sp.]MBP7444636.1 lysophospholipid acyltransferase family protein [Zoogloea sp.]HOY01751.1 lysophospholipid acyltransferase family protein [Zoogloea sp.]HPI59573.1 lysophospholipid acyltransferase family protein [Zoogloea sp.]
MASLIFKFLAGLPLGLLQRLGVLAGWLTYALSPTYRRRLRANLEQALGHDEARRIWRRSVGEIGKQALELAWVLLRPQNEITTKVVQVSGWEHVEAAEATGGGILFITPHLGCFEITAQYFSLHKPITVLYRPPKKAVLQPVINAGRRRGNMHLAPADVSGVRRLIKALRAGEAVGMLPDQVPGGGEGAWLPFFGRPAYTMTLAARLSEVAGVNTIFAWAERLPGGKGFHLRFRPPLTPLDGDTHARAAAINRELEAQIRENPAQYLWGYNRYKRPSGAPPAPATR